MTDSPSPRTFALKRIAEQALAAAQADRFLHGRPSVRTIDGSDIGFEAVNVERGIFQFSITYDETGRSMTTFVPTEMIVWIRSSTAAPASASP